MHSQRAARSFVRGLEIRLKAEKIKVIVYVNQHESVSHIQIRHAYDFSLCFLHELLMSFLLKYTNVNVISIIPKIIDIPIYRKFQSRVIGIYKNPIIIGISIYRNSLVGNVFYRRCFYNPQFSWILMLY